MFRSESTAGKFACGALAFLAFALPLSAQPNSGSLHIVFDLGATKAGPNAGLGVTAGVIRKWDHLQLGTIVELIIGTPQDRNRYYVDPVSGGQTVCRDNSTGQGVSDWLCGNSHVEPGLFGTLEYTFSNRIPVSVGAGYRIGDTYGAVAILGFTGPLARTQSRARFAVVAGAEYWSVRFGVAIPFRSLGSVAR